MTIQLSETHLRESWETLRDHLVQGQQTAAQGPSVAGCLLLYGPQLNMVYVGLND